MHWSDVLVWFYNTKKYPYKVSIQTKQKKTKTAMPLISFGGCILFSLFIVAHQLM